jgi:dihydrodipicolinate synthase/N-acetylneuraminate lyase
MTNANKGIYAAVLTPIGADGQPEFVKVAEDFDVFPSNDGVLLEAIKNGCAGIISATTNASASLENLKPVSGILGRRRDAA